MARLPETQQALSSFSVPSTVKDAEQLMQEELELKEKMINLFAESELKMEQFLASLKEQQDLMNKTVVRGVVIAEVMIKLCCAKTCKSNPVWCCFWLVGHRQQYI